MVSLRPKSADLVAILCLSLSVVGLYAGSLNLWWTWDDFFNLRQVLTRSASDALFSSSFWRSLPNRLFTPLLMLSYEADVALFGLRPSAFYAHQLVGLVLSAVGLYLLLRLWLETAVSFLGALLFVVGIPVIAIAQQLMVRHYLEGLTFAILAIGAFVVSIRRQSLIAAVGASCLYAVAASAKEVYVPLPILLLSLQEGSFRARLRLLTPFWLVAGFYVAWRVSMLGTVFGGYGWSIRPQEWFQLVWRLPLKTVDAFAPSGPIGWLIILAVVALVLFLVSRGPAATFTAVAIAVLLGPILPVSKGFEQRFAFIPWVGFSVAAAMAVVRLPRRIAYGSLILLIVIVGIANRLEWRKTFIEAERMSEEGRFFLSLSHGQLLWAPRIPPAAMVELRWLKEEHLRLRPGAGWFDDRIYVCGWSNRFDKVWTFDETVREMREITSVIAKQEFCSSIRWEAPLSASFEKEGSDLFWELGPHLSGQYALIFEGGVHAYEVPRADGFRIDDLDTLKLRVRFVSAEGWSTYSPELALDFTATPVFRWRR